MSSSLNFLITTTTEQMVAEGSFWEKHAHANIQTVASTEGPGYEVRVLVQCKKPARLKGMCAFMAKTANVQDCLCVSLSEEARAAELCSLPYTHIFSCRVPLYEDRGTPPLRGSTASPVLNKDREYDLLYSQISQNQIQCNKHRERLWKTLHVFGSYLSPMPSAFSMAIAIDYFAAQNSVEVDMYAPGMYVEFAKAIPPEYMLNYNGCSAWLARMDEPSRLLLVDALGRFSHDGKKLATVVAMLRVLD